MADSNSLPKPMGSESKTATQRAKERPRAPLGGAPAVQMPDFAEAEAQSRQVAEKAKDVNRPQPSDQGRRSPEEIAADMERLNQAAKEYNEGKSGDMPKPKDSAEPAGTKPTSREEVAEIVEQMDDFELDSYSRMLEEDQLNNERRRIAIESRCKDMDLVDLITQGEVLQNVPIVPKKFEVTFRSVSSGEDLEIKRMLYLIRREVPRYQVDAYSIMSLTLAIHAINRHPLPSHNDASGNFSEVEFRKKFELVKRYPLQMVADLGINYIWFDLRVKKLFTVEALGNG